MAQLDRLIGALVKHNAEALILEDGQKPSLVVAGARRPIVNTPLNVQQMTRLLSEIARAPEHRSAIDAGQSVSFSYASDSGPVEVSSDARQVIIRVSDTGGGPPATGQVAGAPGPAAPAPVTAASRRLESMDDLLRFMFEAGASDLHVSSGSPPMLRVDGQMAAVEGQAPLDAGTVERLLMSICPERNREEFRAHNDTDFAHEIDGLCRFRCNVFRDRKGPGGVFRAIPSEILTADDLGLSKEIRDLCFLSKGLVLVTGPTGSGKTTTLTALVDLMNERRNDHIITIEDPIEFVHENKRCLINQREVNMHTRDFKTALRAALREDPDIVLVGEMRDLETVAIAMETAETGHLVFGTLHTSSAISTVDRLVDQFPSDRQEQVRVMLAESLKAVIAQVLCRKKGGGRVAAMEILISLPSVTNLIREGKTFQIPSIMQTGKKHGMVTLNDALLDLVRQEVVEPREAYVKAVDKTGLLGGFKAHKIPTDFLDA